MDTKETKRRRRRPAAQESAQRGETASRRREEAKPKRPHSQRKPEEPTERRRPRKETRRVRPNAAQERRRVRKPTSTPKQAPRRMQNTAWTETAQPVAVKSRGGLLLKLGSVAAVVAAVCFCLSLFFRVETIEVAGADKYTPYMIQQASGLEPGDALLTISEARVASRIISKLPYVDRVKVQRKLPDTVQISLTELQVTYAVADETEQWWLISSDGRAVEPISEQKARSYTRVVGLHIRTPEQGTAVSALAETEGEAAKTQQEADEHLAILKSLMTALEAECIIGQIDQIDVSNGKDLRLFYPSLLTVRLGDTNRLEHKIRYMAAAVEQLTQTTGGLLDVSLEYTENAVFTPAG